MHILEVWRAARPFLVALKLLAVLLFSAATATPSFAVSYKILYAFASDGRFGTLPSSNLIIDPATHNMFGATSSGGRGNGGTLFEMTPPTGEQRFWNLTTLHHFGVNDRDGKGPLGRLYVDNSGALYGPTVFGPPLVYRLNPPKAPSTVWTGSFLHNYVCCTDSVTPYGGVIQDARDPPGVVTALYGTTYRGGLVNASCGSYGCGTIYKLVPSGNRWLRTIIYKFRGGRLGSSPVTELVMDGDGSLGVPGALYGTLGVGGASSMGLVFALLPPVAPSTVWQFEVLHSFRGLTTDGANPVTTLIIRDGQLIGGVSAHNGGIFSLTPPVAPKTAWTPKMLYAFAGFDDGSIPNGPSLPGPGGTLFGTTLAGGADNCGTVYRLDPPVGRSKTWTKTILHDFGGVPDGCNPAGYGLSMDGNGVLFGVTTSGGKPNAGTVFSITP